MVAFLLIYELLPIWVQYFESLLQEVEEETERESSAAVKKSLSQNPKLMKLQAKLEKCMEEKKFLDDVSKLGFPLIIIHVGGLFHKPFFFWSFPIEVLTSRYI